MHTRIYMGLFVTGGLPGTECGDTKLWFEFKKPQGVLQMGPSCGLRGDIWSPTPRLLSPRGRDDGGRHVGRDVPL